MWTISCRKTQRGFQRPEEPQELREAESEAEQVIKRDLIMMDKHTRAHTRTHTHTEQIWGLF